MPQIKKMSSVMLRLLTAAVLVMSMIPSTTVFAAVDDGNVAFSDAVITIDNDVTIAQAGDVVTGAVSFNIEYDESSTPASNLKVTMTLEGSGVSESGITIISDGFSGSDTSISQTTVSYTDSTYTASFTVTIPDTLSGVPSLTVRLTVVADNGGNTGGGSVAISLNNPELGVSTSTSGTPISAESDVTVETVVSETEESSTASGVTIVITDDGADYGVTTFQDVTVTRESDGSAVDASWETLGDTLTIMLASDVTITASTAVVVAYVDTLAEGYAYNGSTVNIASTASATETGEATGSTSYTINTPILSIEQSVVMPIIEATDTTQGATSNADGGTSDGEGIVSSDTSSDDTVSVDTGMLSISDNSEATGSESELVINPGESADYSITMKQTDADAIARDVVLTVEVDETAAEAGVYVDVDSIVVTDADGNDVTAAFTIEGDENSTSFTVTGTEDSYLDWSGEQTYVVTYTVVAGDSTNTALRGIDFTTTATLTASNVSEDGYVSDYSVVTIASSIIGIEKTMSIAEIYPGDVVDYVVTVTNIGEMEESTAENIVVTDILSQGAYDIGYRIDETTLAVYDASGNDITDSVEMVWNSDTSFTIYTYASLDDNQSLTIEYQATTSGIPENTYSTNVFNTAVAHADNATYQVAFASGSYIGVDRTDVDLLTGGEVADESILAQTGNTLPYVIGCIAFAAVIAGAGTYIWCRFHGGNR